MVMHAFDWHGAIEKEPRRFIEELNRAGNVLVRMGIDRENEEEISEELQAAAHAIFEAEIAVRKALRKAGKDE